MKILRTIGCFVLAAASAWPSLAQSRSFTVQTASMPTEAEAKAELAKLAATGLPAHLVKANVPGKGVRYRIRFGRFNSMAEAQSRAEQAVKTGAITEFIVTVYDTPTETAVKRREPEPDNTNQKAAAESLTKDNQAPDNRAKKTTATPAASVEAKSAEKKPVKGKEQATTDIATHAGTAKAVSQSSEPKEKQPTPSPVAPKLKEAETANQPPLTAPKTSEPTLKASNAETTTPAATDGAVKAEPKPEKPLGAESRPPTESVTANHATAPDKVSPVPRIAQPPLADALGELDISNRNWKIVRRSTATDKNLRAIFFVDSMTGWAAGDAGAVYRTTDGGKAWKPLLSGAAANINQIFFADWNNGWMLGELARKDNGEPETVVLSTTNGGRSWQKKALPDIQSIFFTSPQLGWAVGKNATILRTEDGGNEWKAYGDLEKVIGLPVESSNYNFGFRDIYFLDAQHGWLVGNFYGREKSHIGGIFFTNDGGATWKRMPITVQTKYSSGRFTPGVLQAVTFYRFEYGVGNRRNGGWRRTLFLRVAHARWREELGTISHAESSGS